MTKAARHEIRPVDLQRLFVCAAISADNTSRGLSDVPKEDLSVTMDTLHALSISVERVKVQLGFNKDDPAIDVAKKLISKNVWKVKTSHV